jgi:RNA polymerase sigma factor (sigma-70 family)
MKPHVFKPECEPLERRDIPQASPWQPPLWDIPHSLQPAQLREQSPPLDHPAGCPSLDFTADFANDLEPWLAHTADTHAETSQGLAYLLNYARKSVRTRRIVREQDQADLVQEIFVEWSKMHGTSPRSLDLVLHPHSQQRADLRLSIYRVLDRYRYAQQSCRAVEIGEAEPVDRAARPDVERVDDRLDLQAWLRSLPDEQAEVVTLHYFEYQSMESIGRRLGLAKQRVSEIHRRALASHPDAPSEAVESAPVRDSGV